MNRFYELSFLIVQMAFVGVMNLFFLTPSYASTTNVVFSGTLLDSPPCIVNDGKNIVVDFGEELMTTRIDGKEYRKKIDFTLDCTSAISSKQRVKISGNTTLFGFDGEVLSTPKDGLGIAIYLNDVRYVLGEWINFNVPAVPEFYAVPQKKDNVKLSGGEFHAMASLIVDYQ
ncbi:fimbrial protein [Pantoea stewartii subsp. indologenes]|uniref:fimbrial protein n=1 Tax=Pantoea stewartii TaxID=66269 RepID=UPI00197D795A|nr:fimbrial protein [Pantoea stewartii]MDK2633229.1 fimbrial protein [Pantoea stewartii subsp. indologenes]